jgi:ser/thr/tyr protein kinase RAD53
MNFVVPHVDLVLELVEGGDLLDFILANDGLDEPTSQHITRQICDALSVCTLSLLLLARLLTPAAYSTSMPKASRIAISSPRYESLWTGVLCARVRFQKKLMVGFGFAQNVLLTRDDPPNVKVADFGLAKVVDSLTMLRVTTHLPSAIFLAC